MLQRGNKYGRIISLLSLIMLVGFLWFHSTHVFASSQWGANYFPNIALVNQDGKTLHFYDDVIKGKTVSINFIFTSCQGACPLETAKLRQVYTLLGDHVGDDIFMYSISIDPERDTPEKLKEYKKKYDIGEGWEFLTGNKAEINLLRKKLGMLRDEHQPLEEDLADHNVSLIVGNEPSGQWIKRNPLETPQILATLLRDRMTNYARPPSTDKRSYAEVQKLAPPSRGPELFRTSCTACHTIGGGNGLGPDLFGVVERRDREWLVNWLKAPDKMLEKKDPLALELYEQYNRLMMPNFGFTDVDVKALLDYIQSKSKPADVAVKEEPAKQEPAKAN